ncbi:MAG: hypothetical protein ABIM99_01330 [Candidatus Dojkabacteria bacterium]
MSYNKTKTQNGQVLLITLLVLTIIGIVIVGLVTLSNRDVTQVVTSEKYEKLYNSAETEVRKFVDNFGKYDKPLTTIPNTFPSSNCQGAGSSFNCTVTDTGTGSTVFKTDITISDTNVVSNFEVKKDRSFVLKLQGPTGASYASNIDIIWDKPAAIEFSIIAQDGSRNLKVIKDVYDLSGTYDGLVGDNPYSTPHPNHPFTFVVKDINNKATSTTINITPGGISGLAVGDNVFYLTITPRLKQDNSSVKFTISGLAGSFPLQMREFIATSVDTNDSSSPLAKVITQIPLAPQMDSVFDYALISNSAINSY